MKRFKVVIYSSGSKLTYYARYDTIERCFEYYRERAEWARARIIEIREMNVRIK
jgi:hypothetical protein